MDIFLTDLTPETLPRARELYNLAIPGSIASVPYPDPNALDTVLAVGSNLYRLAVSDTGDIVGIIGLEKINYIDQNAEVGLAVAAEHQKNGVGTKMAHLFMREVINHFPIHRLHFFCLAGSGSERLVRKLPWMKEEAHLKEVRWDNGKWRDAYLFRWLRTDGVEIPELVEDTAPAVVES